MKKIIVLSIGIIFSLNVFSQCSNQIFHTSGTSIVSGVAITVSSFGTATTNTVYCSSTTPYNIGHLLPTTLTTNSGYIFQFMPAIDTVMLNFSGVSNTPPYQEIVMVEINSVRYSIPSPGNPNGCDAMAILTPDGYITGCAGCGVSGWNGTVIAGNISTVTVIDSPALGGPGGNQSLFSIFFCNSLKPTIIDDLNDNEGFHISPNPATSELRIENAELKIEQIEIFSVLGEKVFFQQPTTNNQQPTVDVSQLSSGIYFVKVRGEKEEHVAKFLKQ